MTAQTIKNRIIEMCSHFTFDYNGKSCGVDPLSHTHFEMWCGDNTYIATNINEVMSIPFFVGKPLSEITNKIDVIDY